MFKKSRESNLPATNNSKNTSGHSIALNLGGNVVSVSVGERVNGAATSSAVDVVLAFDTTGSMSSSIDAMVEAMVSFAAALEQRSLDWRLVTVPFGDLEIPGDKVVTSMKWVSTVHEAKLQLTSMPHFSGGGNGAESSYEAIDAALSRDFRPGVLKVVVLITDDNAHTGRISPGRMLDKVVSADALVYAITTFPRCYTQLTSRTGGECIPLDGRNTHRIVEMLMKFADTLATRCREVIAIGGGSPQKMLEIERGNGRS